MTQRRKYPPPSIQDALRWLEPARHPRVFARIVLHPPPRTGDLYVSVELGLRTLMGGEICCRRFGEKVKASSGDVVMGAVFRACMGAGVWLDDKDPEEVFALFLWETGQK